jgi:hypothetical protein
MMAQMGNGLAGLGPLGNLGGMGGMQEMFKQMMGR